MSSSRCEHKGSCQLCCQDVFQGTSWHSGWVNKSPLNLSLFLLVSRVTTRATQTQPTSLTTAITASRRRKWIRRLWFSPAFHINHVRSASHREPSEVQFQFFMWNLGRSDWAQMLSNGALRLELICKRQISSPWLLQSAASDVMQRWNIHFSTVSFLFLQLPENQNITTTDTERRPSRTSLTVRTDFYELRSL